MTKKWQPAKQIFLSVDERTRLSHLLKNAMVEPPPAEMYARSDAFSYEWIQEFRAYFPRTQRADRLLIILLLYRGQYSIGWEDTRIAAALDVSRWTVARVRGAFHEGGSTRRLEEAVERHRPQQGRKSKLSAAQQRRLIALARTAPPGLLDRWSLRLLAQQFSLRGRGPKVSAELVRRTLAQHGVNLQ